MILIVILQFFASESYIVNKLSVAASKEHKFWKSWTSVRVNLAIRPHISNSTACQHVSEPLHSTWFLIRSLISLPAVCHNLLCSLQSLHSLLLKITAEHAVCFRGPAVARSALYPPDIYTCIQQPPSFPSTLPHRQPVISMHPASVALLQSSLPSVGLHSSLRWNCFPSHESSPCNTLVCDVCVCVLYFQDFFSFSLMVLPYSAVKLDPQWEFMKDIIEGVTLWICHIATI